MPLLKKIGLLIETETDNCDNENEKCYEPLASILHLQFKDMNLLEDDSNITIEILKAKALATANNNSLRTTSRIITTFRLVLKLTLKLNKLLASNARKIACDQIKGHV